MLKLPPTHDLGGRLAPSPAAPASQRVKIKAVDAIAQRSPSASGRNRNEPAGTTVEAADMSQAVERNSRKFICVSKLPRRALAALQRHWVLLIACGGCLGLGGALGKHLQPDLPTNVTETDRPAANEDAQVVFASLLRRHEPIAPLAPFEHLDAATVELGRRLFHEPGLSSSGTVSCASCHPLEAGGTLRVPLPQKLKGGLARYNAPTVFNTALNFAQSWEGGVSTLEKYVDTSISAAHELDSSWERITKFLKSDSYYREIFQKVMHGEPTPDTIRAALATFQRSLITVNSKFDQWLQGTEAALDSDEFGGYFLFKKFGCISCHQGAGVGGTMFQPLGVAKPYFEKNAATADLGRFNVTGHERDRHVFRVPPLRNVQLTAPYLHDGSIPTLEMMVRVMIEYQCGQEFSSEDVRRLTLFLNSLTGKLPVAVSGKIYDAHLERNGHPPTR